MENGNIESPSGQNKVCICYEDLCNNSPWLEWSKPTRRGPTTHRPATRKPAVVTTENVHLTDQDGILYSTDTPTDSERAPRPTDSKSQSNGVKALNDDMLFVTILTIIIYIFCKAKN